MIWTVFGASLQGEYCLWLWLAQTKQAFLHSIMEHNSYGVLACGLASIKFIM